MGIFDKFKEKADEAMEHGKAALGGHKHDTSDAMSQGGQKAAERMPGSSGDAMGDMAGKAKDTGPDPLEQAESDMESEGGHEPM